MEEHREKRADNEQKNLIGARGDEKATERHEYDAKMLIIRDFAH